MAASMSEFKKHNAIRLQFIHLSRHFINNAKVYFLLLFLITLTSRCSGNDDFQRDEFLKREYSLTKPYQGLGSSSSSHWDLLGNAIITPEYVRLTPDLQSRQGGVWSRIPFYVRDWELQVHFKIHGQGKKNLNGDGLALWLTRERMQIGPVFGNINHFTGLGIFIDTYPNHENQHERSFPFISAMVGNGTVAYDHDQDGRNTDLGGCQAAVRNVDYDTFVLVRYVKNMLTVMIDIEGKQDWKECVEIPGVHLPQGYYFGASSLTGDLSDNHDLISLKLFELTVERTPEELENEQEVKIPSVDYREIPVEVVDEGMSTLTLLFLFIFSVVGLVVLIVVLLFIYARWKERSRKRFY
ncbi:lectin, mannose-binding 2-like b isoform X1 [Tachysurus fulvidraco]|uniref:lectin, mannose-binding 2-like b isoform X1 n=1 Tax=Tachysurus fulvidraco TaxID=1234273 RepID=UPI000F50078F|nr:lectin, mannose-binding 2-like b isoform X1 [Tachysurus fulvidraco]